MPPTNHARQSRGSPMVATGTGSQAEPNGWWKSCDIFWTKIQNDFQNFVDFEKSEWFKLIRNNQHVCNIV